MFPRILSQLQRWLAGEKAKNPLAGVFRSPDLQRAIPLLALAALLYNILGLALPMAILQIMDRVVLNQSMETLTVLAIGAVFALVVEEILREVNGVVTGWLGARFEHKASVDALSRLMRVSLRSLQREEAGIHVERIAATGQVAEFYSGQALLVLFDIPFVLIYIAMIYTIGGWVALVPVVLLGIFVYAIARFGTWLYHHVENRHLANDRRHNFLVEVLTGIHTVKTMAMEAQMERRHERLQAANAEMSETMSYGSAMAGAMGTLFSQIMIVGIVFAGALGVLAGQMTPGGLAACMLLAVRALQPLRRGLTIWSRYQSFVSAQARLREIAAMPVVDGQGKPPLPTVRDGMEFRNVTLERKGGAPVFQNLFLTIRKGECIAIQGESGSGKSSLLSMLNGMNRPDSGEILVDGRNLQDFCADSVQLEVGLLPQTGALIAGTILDNMTMFEERLRESALEVAAQLGLDRVVSGMKLGYETPLGEGSAETLPSGVRQIIAIVRVLARNPSVILFDEANNSLDMEGDQRLLEYVKRLKGDRTIILITHRPSWQKLADRTLRIADGKLVDGLASAAAFSTASLKAPAAIKERPVHADDLSAIVHEHYDEASDFSRCLSPLLHAIGWQGNARQLMVAMPHMQRCLDISGLCATMANLGLAPSDFTGSLSGLDQRLMPCVFVPDDAPAKVILERLPDGRLRCFDSAGAAEATLPADSGEGRVYVFKQQEQATAQTRNETNFFGNLLRRFRRHIVLAFVLTVLNTVFALAPPLFVRSIYDRILPTGDVRMSTYMLFGVLIVLAMDFHVRNLRSKVIAHTGGRADYIVGSSVFSRVINLPASATGNASVRRQVGRMRNFESMRDFFLGPLAVIAFDMPANLLMVAAIGVINPWALLAVAASALAFFLLALATRGISERAVARSSQASSVRAEFLDESLTQMNTIRSSGSRSIWVERFRDLSGKAVMANYLDRQVHARISGAAQVLGNLSGFAVLVVSALSSIQGGISSGTMMATMMLVWRLISPMQNLFLAATSMVKIRSSMNQVQNLMRLPTEGDGGVQQTIRPASQGAVGFSRVSFRYLSDADPSLLGMSFSVAPGMVVVIAGPNGSGKSTVLKLLTRAFVPQAGTIRLDGVDIRQLTVADLRARVSYMPQVCDIFYGTITQNLRLAHPAATEAEVRWAAEMAGLMPEIESMPRGFATRISNSQSEQLPNGFRQRLALARAVLKPAPVVLLDEPGTGMDEAGEQALQRCIEWLRGRSTLLMVSHRPAHMRLADFTIYLERGSVAAMGPFDSIKERLIPGVPK